MPIVDVVYKSHTRPYRGVGLVDLLALVPKGGIAVEIGVYEGDATAYFAEHFDTVYAVDPWPTGHVPWEPHRTFKDIEDTFDKNKAPNVIKMKTTSVEAAKQIGDVDFVYIDAKHEYPHVKEDICAWMYKTKYIGGHDYHPGTFPGVVMAVKEFFKNVTVFEDTSWLVIRGDLLDRQ